MWKRFLSRKIIWSVISAYIIIIFNIRIFFSLISNNVFQMLLADTGLSLILDISYLSWQNIAFGGIILTILLRNFKVNQTIVIYALLISIYQLISLNIYVSISIPEYYLSLSEIIFSFVYNVSIMLLYSYLVLKTKNIVFVFIAATTVNIIMIILVFLIQIGVPIIP